MSPFFVKIAISICTFFLIGSFIIVLTNIHDIKEKSESTPDKAYGILRQRGEYWIWHDFIRANNQFKDNDSLTLTTHASYMDLGLLPDLLERWEAPISLAIYVSGADFDKAIESLAYLNSCLKLGNRMRRYLSIHLVFHEKHLPTNLYITENTYPKMNPCADTAPYKAGIQDVTYWFKQNLPYPVNLLRNVARVNAQTYYIVPLDMQLMPSPHLAKQFLDFMWHSFWRRLHVSKPFKTVYCLRTFSQRPNASLAVSKYQLILMLQTVNVSKPDYDEYKHQVDWLLHSNPKFKLKIYNISKEMNLCSGYVSVNKYEPLYDEQCDMDSDSFDYEIRTKLLTDLDYNFITLDGPFLMRHELDSWKLIDRYKATNKKCIQSWSTWHRFYTNLLSLKLN